MVQTFTFGLLIVLAYNFNKAFLAFNFEVDPQNAEESLLSTSKTIICNTNTKTINFYYFPDTENETSLAPYLLRAIHTCKSAPIQVISLLDARIIPKSGSSLQVFIIPNNSELTIQICLKSIKRRQRGKHFLKYFLIFESTQSKNRDYWLDTIFYNLWSRKNVLNAAIIHHSSDGSKQVFMYNPFANSNSRLIELDSAALVSRDIFQQPIALNLQQREIVVTMYADEVLISKNKNGKSLTFEKQKRSKSNIFSRILRLTESN